MDNIHGMMGSPWTYVILATVLVVIVAVPLIAVRVFGAREKRGEDRRQDPHLG